jgi:hypothetical protein
MNRLARATLPPIALLAAALSGAALAQPGPGAPLPPDAAATPGTSNSTVGSTGQVPTVAYPQAPAATPASEGADRARPPTDREKAEQKLR